MSRDVETIVDAPARFAEVVFSAGSGSRSGSRRIIVAGAAAGAAPFQFQFYAKRRFVGVTQVAGSKYGGELGENIVSII